MSETNDNFQDLKRLLKLKRHEVPPPGYFNHFSGDVMSRIRAGETSSGEGFFERIQSESSFFSALLRILDVKPGVIGAFATSLCVVLVVGVLFVDRGGQDSTDDMVAVAQPTASASSANQGLAVATPVSAPESGITISTNPISSFQPANTLFGSPQNPLFQAVNFAPVSQ